MSDPRKVFDQIAAIPTGRHDGDEFEIVGKTGGRETRLDVVLGWEFADARVEDLVDDLAVSPEEAPEACTWARQEAARDRLHRLRIDYRWASENGEETEAALIDREATELDRWLADLYRGVSV